MIVEQLYTKCLAQAAYYIESKGEAVVIAPLGSREQTLAPVVIPWNVKKETQFALLVNNIEVTLFAFTEAIAQVKAAPPPEPNTLSAIEIVLPTA